ncbi:MAG: hypothetical protein PHE55_15085 [Methylococcaceae bacterium]|nr:hypothetical protein [Methylococcaceae bacterium]
MTQTDLIRQAKQQEMARHNDMMTLLADLERRNFFNKDQIYGLQEENLWLKQLANHDDEDCRSFADTLRA